MIWVSARLPWLNGDIRSETDSLHVSSRHDTNHQLVHAVCDGLPDRIIIERHAVSNMCMTTYHQLQTLEVDSCMYRKQIQGSRGDIDGSHQWYDEILHRILGLACGQLRHWSSARVYEKVCWGVQVIWGIFDSIEKPLLLDHRFRWLNLEAAVHELLPKNLAEIAHGPCALTAWLACTLDGKRIAYNQIWLQKQSRFYLSFISFPYCGRGSGLTAPLQTSSIDHQQPPSFHQSQSRHYLSNTFHHYSSAVPYERRSNIQSRFIIVHPSSWIVGV